MTHQIGIAGVTSEAILMGADKNHSIKEMDLIESLKKRFNISDIVAKKAIHFAIMGNLIERSNNGIILKQHIFRR